MIGLQRMCISIMVHFNSITHNTADTTQDCGIISSCLYAAVSVTLLADALKFRFYKNCL